MTSLAQLFVFIDFRYTFKYWYRKITEQRQNFANSDHYTNEDAEIILIGHRPRFCFHRPGMEGVLRKMFLKIEAMSGGRLSGQGDCWYNGTVIDRCRSVSTLDMCTVWRMESCWWHWHLGRFQDLRLQVACTLHQTDHIIVINLNKRCC